MSWMRKLAPFVVLLTSVSIWIGERETKGEITLNAIVKQGTEARKFYELNQRLPLSLEELKISPDHRKDGWGHPITYAITSRNTFILTGVGGGGNTNKDNIVYQFDVLDPSALAGKLMHGHP
jgi:hypothetical protein